MLLEKRAGLSQAAEFGGNARHPSAAEMKLRLAVVEWLRAGANQFLETAGEETVERADAAWQHDMKVPSLWNTGARDRLRRLFIPVEQRDATKLGGKGARRHQAGDAGADHDGVLTVRRMRFRIHRVEPTPFYAFGADFGGRVKVTMFSHSLASDRATTATTGSVSLILKTS